MPRLCERCFGVHVYDSMYLFSFCFVDLGATSIVTSHYLVHPWINVSVIHPRAETFRFIRIFV